MAFSCLDKILLPQIATSWSRENLINCKRNVGFLREMARVEERFLSENGFNLRCEDVEKIDKIEEIQIKDEKENENPKKRKISTIDPSTDPESKKVKIESSKSSELSSNKIKHLQNKIIEYLLQNKAIVGPTIDIKKRLEDLPLAKCKSIANKVKAKLPNKCTKEQAIKERGV